MYITPLTVGIQTGCPFPKSFLNDINHNLAAFEDSLIRGAEYSEACDQRYDKLLVRISKSCKSRDVLGRASAQRTIKICWTCEARTMPSQQATSCVEDTTTIEAKEAARKIRKAATTARRRARNDAHHNECKQAISQWPESILQDLQHSRNSLLPLDLWRKILNSFCDDLDFKGVRGPSVIARELSLVSRVSKEVYAASRSAFQHLSTLCPSTDSIVLKLKLRGREYDECQIIDNKVVTHSGIVHTWESLDSNPGSAQWDAFNAFVSDPKSLTAVKLKFLCAAMHLRISPPKAVLIQELMKSMSLKYPTPTPARLVLAVQWERRDYLSSGDPAAGGKPLLGSLRRARGESLTNFRDHYIWI